MDHMRFNASYKAMQVTSMQRRHARQVQHTSARPRSGCSLVLRQHAGLVPRDAVGLLKHGAALDCSATALLDQPPEQTCTLLLPQVRSCGVLPHHPAAHFPLQFDPELLADQRRRGWGDRQLSSLGIETRPDGAFIVSVAVERVDGKILRSAQQSILGRACAHAHQQLHWQRVCLMPVALLTGAGLCAARHLVQGRCAGVITCMRCRC